MSKRKKLTYPELAKQIEEAPVRWKDDLRKLLNADGGCIKFKNEDNIAMLEFNKLGFTFYVDGHLVIDGSIFTHSGIIDVAKNPGKKLNLGFHRIIDQRFR